MLFKRKRNCEKVNTTSGIELIEVTVSEHEAGELAVVRILVALLAAVSIFGILLTSFNWSLGNNVYMLLVIGVAACCLLVFTQSHKRIEIAVNVLLISGITVVVVFYKELFLNGMIILMNRVIASINVADNRIWHEFAVKGTYENQIEGLKLALLIMVLLTSCILAWIVKYKDIVVLEIMDAILIGSVLYFSCDINIIYAVTGCAAWSGLWIMAASRHVNHIRPVLVVMIVCIVCLSMALLVLKPWKDYESPFVESVKSGIISGVERIRYGSDALPAGEFSKGMDLDKKTEVRIKVTVWGNDPKYLINEPLYLKGYTGSKYEYNCFALPEREIYAGAYLGMFDYLESNDFQPQYQVGRYLDLNSEAGGNHVQKDKPINIEIDNLSASRKYVYAPAGITMETGNIRNGNTFYDTMLLAGGLFGQRSYSYDTWVSDSKLLNGTAENYWIEKAEEYGAEYETFAQGEKVYREFVYDTYLELPKWFEEERGSTSFKELGGETVGDVVESVRTYLKTHAKYDAGSDWSLDGRDLFNAFLKEEKNGNAMHFAAAGTMLFRMCNVPARYAEGYYLSEEILRTGEAEYELTDEDAHAWIEIYLDGIGFVPIEVTPGFYQHPSKNKCPVENQDIEIVHKAQSADEHTQTVSKNILTAGHISLILLLALLLTGLAFLIRIGFMRFTWKKALEHDDSGIAVSAACRYIEELLNSIGITVDFKEADKITESIEGILGSEIAAGYRDSIGTIRKIRFSEVKLTIEERRILVEYLGDLKKTVWKKAARKQKLKMTVWKGM